MRNDIMNVPCLSFLKTFGKLTTFQMMYITHIPILSIDRTR